MTGLSKESIRKIEELKRVNVNVQFTYTGRFFVCSIENEDILVLVPDVSKQFSFSRAYSTYLSEIVTGKEERKLG